MDTSSYIEDIINHNLVQLRSSVDHNITPASRIDIYSKLEVIPKLLDHLAIITSQKVSWLWTKHFLNHETHYRKKILPKIVAGLEQEGDFKHKNMLFNLLTQIPDQQSANLTNLPKDEILSWWGKASYSFVMDALGFAYVETLIARNDNTIWKSFFLESPHDTAGCLLAVAYYYLQGNIEIKVAQYILGEAGAAISNEAEHYDVPLEIEQACTTTLATLNQITRGWKNLMLVDYVKRNIEVTNNSIDSYNSDSAGVALKAYAYTYEDFEFVGIDLQKSLEFWEWWLTEAIPQAWKLAQETYNPPQS